MITSPERTGELIATSFVMKLAAGFGVYVLLVLYALLFVPDQETKSLIAVLGLMLLTQSLLAFDFHFQATLLSKYTVVSQNLAFALLSAGRVWFILVHGSLITFAWLAVAETVIAGSLMGYFYWRYCHIHGQWGVDLGLMKQLISESWAVVLSGLALTVYLKIDQVMLQHMTGPDSVGTYSAAVRISEMWYFIPTVMAASLLPSIIKSSSKGDLFYLQRMRQYFDLSVVLAYTLALPVGLCADLIVHSIYGVRYAGAGSILALHIWACPFLFLGTAREVYLLHERRLIFSMGATLAGAISNVAFNLLWIPRYSGKGAAMATLFSYAISAFISSFFYRPTFRLGVIQLKSLIFPWTVLASLLRSFNGDGNISGRYGSSES